MYASIAPKLLDLGIYSVPIKPGTKHPGGIDDWPTLSSTKEGIEELCRLYPNYGIGVRTGPLSGIIALDFDVWDEEKYKTLVSISPKSPIGKFGEKGGTYFYRICPGMVGKLFLNSGILRDDGKEDKIEILTGTGGSQSVIPPTIHQNTKKPYIWLQNEALWEISSVEDLPVYTFEHWEELERLFKELYKNAKGKKSTGKGGRNDTLKAHLAANLRDGYNLNEIIFELIKKDQILHGGNALFLDSRENNTSYPEVNAMRFAVSNIASINAMRIRDKKKPYSLGFCGDSGLKENPSAEFYIETINHKGKPVKTPDYQACVTYFKEKYDCTYSKGMLYVYNGNSFVRRSDSEMRGTINAASNFPVRPEDMGKFLSAIEDGTVIYDEFTTLETPKHINMQNGVYSLDENILKPHPHKFKMTYCLPYEFDEKAKCPKWEAFLKDIFTNPTGYVDQEKIELLQEIFGYVLEGGEAYLQKSFWFLGEGQNGKGTVISILRGLVGKENVSAVPLQRLDHDFSVVTMLGKKMNFIEEIPSIKDVPSDAFKNIVGGGTVNVAFKNKDVFHADVRARMVISCNSKPKFNDASYGILRRIVWVGFDKEIAENDRDTGLKYKLLEELPGIFNWAVIGYKRLKEFKELTKTVDQSTIQEEYKQETDYVYRWFNECVKVDKNMRDTWYTNTALMWQSMKNWCQDNDIFPPPNKISWGRRLTSFLRKQGVTRPDGEDMHHVKRYHGVSLTR